MTLDEIIKLIPKHWNDRQIRVAKSLIDMAYTQGRVFQNHRIMTLKEVEHGTQNNAGSV